MQRHALEIPTGPELTGDPSPQEWLHFLPEGWKEAVESPLYIVRHREYEMDACRCIGYDGEDRPCFTSHRFVLTVEMPDHPAGTKAAPAYTEELAAWRLRDERWLVYRMVSGAAGTLPRGFYVVSPDMPR